MTLLITLSTAGGETGPFNLYSNVDGFTSAFEVGVAKIDLLMGYISYTVPDGTTVIRVMSDSVCKNYIDLIVNVTTTSTTTDPPIPPPPTTTTKIPCFCYNLTGIGEYRVDWIDCDGVPQYFKLSNFDENICAQQDSFIYSDGDGSLTVTGGIDSCTEDGDCPVTTTTTSSSSSTTTTTSSSSTTTSTTTGIPSYSFELLYSDMDCSTACSTLVPNTYYSADTVLGEFSVVCADPALTIPAIDGYYSNGSDCFTITDGIGTIDSVSSCSLFL
jgi:peroxiredoxin